MTTSSLRRSDCYTTGVEMFDQGLYADAIVGFEQFLKSDEPEGSPRRRLALFYLGEARAQLAQQYFGHHALDKAEREIKRAIDIHPRYPDLRYQLACVYKLRGTLTWAAHELEAAVEINPRFAKALLLLGLIRYQECRYEEAMALIKRAIEVEPAYSTETLAEALAAHTQGRFDESLRKLTSLQATQVDEIEYYYRLGRERQRRGDLQEAIKNYREALSIRPEYPDIRNQLGLALLAIGDPKSAVVEFEKALQGNQFFVCAMINSARAYRQLGEVNLAVDNYRRALRIDPENEDIKEALEELVNEL